jgi:dihydroorotase
MQQITLRKPDDWHIHLRDDSKLTRTAADAAQQFNRVLVMPNLTPPVTTIEAALSYRERIMCHAKLNPDFNPLMTLYLTDTMSIDTIQQAAENPNLIAAKLYPAGATTNSDSGVTDIKKIYPILEAMQKYGLVLCVHGEVTNHEVDIFDREAKFIDSVLLPIVESFPELNIVLEHITTQQAVEFVENTPSNIAATITAHHLLLNRNDLLVGGIKPHHYCLPVLKRTKHQQALITAATSGNSKFFLGTDSAPHTINQKQSACGCAGIYTAYAAIEYYAQAFELAGKLDRLDDFASRFGSEFYGLPINQKKITLSKQPWQLPETLSFGDEQVIPLLHQQQINWKLTANDE